MEHYLRILSSVGLVRKMDIYEGGSSLLRTPTKFLLGNTNLLHAMQQYLGDPISRGMEREIFFVQSMQEAKIELFYSKVGDYRTEMVIFEVGGKNKTRKQVKDATLPAYLVKDDILYPLKREIPLFLLGFLY